MGRGPTVVLWGGLILGVGCAWLSVARAEEAAPAGTGPAGSAPTAEAVPPSLGPKAQFRYDQLVLHREGERLWTVSDGTGRVLALEDWSALTGDREPLLRATRAQARGDAGLWRALGVALGGVGALSVASLHPFDEDVGTAGWKQQLTSQDALVTVGAVAAAAGFGLVVVSFAEPPPPRRVRDPVRVWVQPAQADVVIEAYNRQLREDVAVPEYAIVRCTDRRASGRRRTWWPAPACPLPCG